MSATIENLAKSRVKIHVEVAADDIRQDLVSAGERLSSKSPLSGFRPGKVPYDVAAKRFGEQAILEEALESIVRRTFVQAVKDHQLKTIGQPEITMEKIAPGNPVVYSATCALLPDVQLPAYEDVKVKRKRVPVTDDDVARAIDDLRNMLAESKSAERPAQLGDKVEIDVDVAVDRVAIDGGMSRNHPAILGKSSFIPGFEDQVVGMRKGEAKEFQLKFPKDYRGKNLAGKTGEFKVTLKSVEARTLPEVNDDFAKKTAKLATVAELRAYLRKDLEAEREQREDEELEVHMLDELVKKTTFDEIPDLLIENEIEHMLDELKEDVERRNMKFRDYLQTMKKDEASLKRDLLPNAERRVKTALAIRRIVELEKLFVGKEEIDEELERARVSVPEEQRSAEHFGSEDFRNYLETVLLNRKAIQHAKSKVRITE